MIDNLLIISGKFLSTQRYSTFGFSFFSIYLALVTASWGQNIPSTPLSVERVELAQVFNQDLNNDKLNIESSSQGKKIAKIRVRYVDRNNQFVKGKTKPEIIIREFDLQPGDIYAPELAQEGLARVNDLIIIERAILSLEESTTDNNVVMIVTVEESNPFFFSFALTLPPPTALKGSARPVTVIPQSNRANGLSGGVRFGFLNLGGTNKVISLGAEAGRDILGFDLDYRNFWRHDRGYAVNFFSSHFLPLNLFGFTEGDRTLVLNFQGGTIIGDLPPYEAFSLGGSSSVRGFGGGELGTGRSFIQGTAEYRFPIFDFNAFREEYNVGGTLFLDYGTDLGSADSVRGRPAEVRDKPGSALGYGLGLRVPSSLGTLRLEFAFNTDGGNALHFSIGERF